MKLRVATWNLNHRKPETQEKAWRYLAEDVCADIVVAQEARPPKQYSHGGYSRIGVDGKNGMDWGTVVVSLNPAINLTEIPKTVWEFGAKAAPGGYLSTHPGAAAAARAILPDGRSLTVVGLYGQLERLSNETTYAVTSMHSILSEMTPLLDYNRGDLVVVGGDLNVSSQWEGRYRPWHKAVLQRIADFGLLDCLERNLPPRNSLDNCFCDRVGHCNHVQTYRHQQKESSRPWQIDYLFASAALDANLTRAQAWDRIEAWQLSDHCPVVAEFEI